MRIDIGVIIMATAVVSAAFSVVGKALAPLAGDLLKKWAASVDLGSNVKDLEKELMSVRILLEHILGKEIENSALKEVLQKLQDLAYDAEDVLDELDYFRIQDELDGTSDTANQHPKGSAHNLALNVRHTAKSVVGKLICLPACLSASTPGGTPLTSQSNQEASGCKAKLTIKACCNPIHGVGKHFPCSTLPYVDDDHDHTSDSISMANISAQNKNHTNDEPLRLSFNRVDASNIMQDIVKELRSMPEIVSQAIATLGSSWSKAPDIAQSRCFTNYASIEPKLYGRAPLMNSIVHDITQGKYCGNEELTVIPIVGPGGIGKTMLAQHIYCSEAVKNHFNVKVWTCVSLNFNVNKLIEKIEKDIPQVDGERKCTAGELIEQRLKNRRFLLVLDDIWGCTNQDVWKQLLLPFKKSEVQGNIIIVTTRIPEQAQMVQTIDKPIFLQGLDHQEFKELFLDIVFGDDQSKRHNKFLLETGDKIVGRLKGSPLAAKTVGRLLKTQLDLVHWTKVLESKEWEQGDSKDDIIPALKLSYDYLPMHLKQCFSYCALFPQDYKFQREEIINFWIGLDVLRSSHGESRSVEYIGLSHLRQLVNHGFFEMKGTYYIIHDLLHELAWKVSSHECLRIDSSQSQVRSLQVMPSIRHLSINIDGTSVKDRSTFKYCVDNFNTLITRLKVQKLRTLMLFGKHHGCFVKTFSGLLREAKALRVIFLSKASYNVEDLLHNFYGLLHLRYLRIGSSFLYKTRFPNKISRFYHMMVLDAKHCGIMDLPKDISNLGKLRHLLVRDDTIHSSIVGVGKLKSLQELRRFVVKKDDQGFELRQIGHLEELSGSLHIDNLENVEVPEEGDEAKLVLKSHICELILCWSNDGSINDYSTLEEHVLERLKPSCYLQKLSIIGNRGDSCPSWLGTDLSIKGLESLCLDGVAWKTYPPIGELWLEDDVPPMEISCNSIGKRFQNLKRLQLSNSRCLKKWVVHAPCQLFPYLRALVIEGCSNLVELSFSHSACCQQKKGAYANLFPRLSHLKIVNCPQLVSFPPVPWTETRCSVLITGIGSSCLHRLDCRDSGHKLEIEGKDAPDNTVWDVLDFRNLTKLKRWNMCNCQPLPLHQLQMLSSLRTLEMSCSSKAIPFVDADSHVKYQFPVESLTIHKWTAGGKELTQLLTYFPKLSDLRLFDSQKVTGLGLNVSGQWATETPGPSSSSSLANINKVEQQQGTRAKDDVIVASQETEHGLLLLPPQLQELRIWDCNKDGRTGGVGGGGLLGLSSLRQLTISQCSKLLTTYPCSSLSPSSPFPEVGMKTLVPLSNLTSLTSLDIWNCRDLRCKGLLSLLNQGHLTKLCVGGMPNFFVDSEQSQVHEQEILPSCLSKLQELKIEDVAGFTAAFSRHSLLFSSLTTLEITWDNKVEHFTEEQEALLFANSLDVITFSLCRNLQSLPERLHRLPNLKRLYIWQCRAIQMLPNDVLPSSLEKLDIRSCPEIRSLPKMCSFPSSLQTLGIENCQLMQMRHKDALPSSLQVLEIGHCPEIRSLPKDYLPNSLQKLVIRNCPAIRSLDDLPNSLRELDVYFGNSEELRRQCRKLINIIPLVRT